MRQCRTTLSGRMLLVLTPLALAACAGTPEPKAELGAAVQAIENAEQAGAQQYSPVELELARSKMDAANQALRADHDSEARLLALEARADANYAASKARSGAAQQAASVANRDWNALGRSVQSGSSGTGASGTGASGTGAGLGGGPTSWGSPGPQQRPGMQGAVQ